MAKPRSPQYTEGNEQDHNARIPARGDPKPETVLLPGCEKRKETVMDTNGNRDGPATRKRPRQIFDPTATSYQSEADPQAAHLYNSRDNSAAQWTDLRAIEEAREGPKIRQAHMTLPTPANRFQETDGIATSLCTGSGACANTAGPHRPRCKLVPAAKRQWPSRRRDLW